MANTQTNNDIENITGDNNPNLTEMEMLAGQQEQTAQTQEQEVPAESAEQEPQEKETNWEDSAKYFQSEKDKLYAENQKIKDSMKKYESLGEFIDSRPDVQDYLKQAIDGKENLPQAETLTPPEEFDPWEAYNDPNSESFKYRATMEQNAINQAVSASQKKLDGQLKVEKQMREFDNELSQQGLDANDKQAFYNFANTPLTELGTDTLVKMWQAADGRVNTPSNASGPREFESVRRTQAEPTPVGILQGEQPPKPNLDDDVWNRIVAATNRTKVI